MADEHAAPHQPAMEKGLLGAALNSTDALTRLMQELKAEHFYVLAHQATFQAMQRLAATGGSDTDDGLDGLLLARTLERGEGLVATVPDPYELVADIHNNRAPLTVLDQYIDDIRGCYHARAVISLGRTMQVKGSLTKGEPAAVAQILQEADAALQAATEATVGLPWRSIGDLAQGVHDGSQAIAPTLPTGFVDLDRRLGGGLRSGSLVVVAARPAVGKSTITTDVARHAGIRCDIPGLTITLEMTGQQLAARLVAAEAGVDLGHILSRDPVTEVERQRIDDAIARLTDAPIYIDDSTDRTWPAVRALIVAAHRRLGIQYAVVDYIQLLDGEAGATSREQALAAISKDMKKTALLLGITIFAVAQLNRGPEQRTDKRPKMSDLRESGQLEQDSDVVMLLYRPDLYDPTTDRAGEADVIVDKHRWGPPFTTALAFQGHYARFVDMAADEAPYGM